MYTKNMSKVSFFVFFISFYILTFASTLVSAQITMQEKCKGCFRGRPQPTCCSSFIVETFYKRNLISNNSRIENDGFLIGLDFGLMINKSEKYGYGASIYMAGDDDGSRFGIRPRYRYWFNKNLQLDLTAGLFIMGPDNYIDPKFPGFVASSSLAVFDILSIDLHYEMFRYSTTRYSLVPEDKISSSLYLGATGRSYAAFIMPLLLGISFAIHPDFEFGNSR